MGTQQEAVVASLFHALEAGDFEALLACFAPTAKYHVWAWQEPRVGHAAIRAEFERQFNIFTGFRSKTTSRLSTDSVVFIERVDSFRMGDKDVELHASAVFAIDETVRIVAWRDYYDTGELTAQLSV